MDELDHFLEQYPHWRERLSSNTLWLSIPSPILEVLGEAKQNIPAWLKDDGAWNEETAFSELTEHLGAIGIRYGQAFNYSLIERMYSTMPTITDEQFHELGWDKTPIRTPERAREQLRQADEQLGSMRLRLVSYVGWLTSNPIYVKERDIIKAHWESLRNPPSFPLQIIDPPGAPRNIPDAFIKKDGARLNKGLDAFGSALYDFLMRWGLIKLEDWDYPQPQGPLIGGKEILAFVRNNDFTGQIAYIPAWYDIVDAKDQFIDSVKNAQRNVRDEGRFIENDSWPVPKHARYAGIFYCLHALRAIELRGKISHTSPDYETVLGAIAPWLEKIAPENRGGANKGKGKGGKEDTDDAARVRRLMAYARQRMSGTVPKELLSQKKDLSKTHLNDIQ